MSIEQAHRSETEQFIIPSDPRLQPFSALQDTITETGSSFANDYADTESSIAIINTAERQLSGTVEASHEKTDEQIAAINAATEIERTALLQKIAEIESHGEAAKAAVRTSQASLDATAADLREGLVESGDRLCLLNTQNRQVALQELNSLSGQLDNLGVELGAVYAAQDLRINESTAPFVRRDELKIQLYDTRDELEATQEEKVPIVVEMDTYRDTHNRQRELWIDAEMEKLLYELKHTMLDEATRNAHMANIQALHDEKGVRQHPTTFEEQDVLRREAELQRALLRLKEEYNELEVVTDRYGRQIRAGERTIQDLLSKFVKLQDRVAAIQQENANRLSIEEQPTREKAAQLIELIGALVIVPTTGEDLTSAKDSGDVEPDLDDGKLNKDMALAPALVKLEEVSQEIDHLEDISVTKPNATENIVNKSPYAVQVRVSRRQSSVLFPFIESIERQ